MHAHDIWLCLWHKTCHCLRCCTSYAHYYVLDMLACVKHVEGTWNHIAHVFTIYDYEIHSRQSSWFNIAQDKQSTFESFVDLRHPQIPYCGSKCLSKLIKSWAVELHQYSHNASTQLHDIVTLYPVRTRYPCMLFTDPLVALERWQRSAGIDQLLQS